MSYGKFWSSRALLCQDDININDTDKVAIIKNVFGHLMHRSTGAAETFAVSVLKFKLKFWTSVKKLFEYLGRQVPLASLVRVAGVPPVARCKTNNCEEAHGQVFFGTFPHFMLAVDRHFGPIEPRWL